MKVLITGGAGYIGTELVHQLAQDEDISEIIIYDNLSRNNYNLFLFNALPSDKIRLEAGDLLNSRHLQEVLEGVDVVFHLAAKVSTPFANDDPHIFEQVNHWGTAELSYAIEESGVSTVIYTSSCSVYGAKQEMADIETPPDPGTFYGISKRRGEKMLKRLHSDKNIYIIRLGNVYGYGNSMRFDAVINKFMFEAQYKNRIRIRGSGHQYRPFLHVQRGVKVLHDILRGAFPTGTYNLVEENYSILEISDILKELYPSLETLFINQDLEMRSLKVSPATQLRNYQLYEPGDIKADLQQFQDHFSFAPRQHPEVSTP